MMYRQGLLNFLVCCAALLVVACGGAGPDKADVSLPDGGAKAQALTAPPPSSNAVASTLSDVSVQSLTKVRETRIGRTLFEYEFKVVVRNSGAAAENVSATLEQGPGGLQIVDGFAYLGTIASGQSTTSQDTIVVRQDRLATFDPNSLVWKIQGFPSLPTAVVDFGADVPQATTQKVVELVTTMATGQTGKKLVIDSTGKIDGSTVFALDQSGNIVLAGSAKPDARVQLTAASTALELVRLALPAIPNLATRDENDRFVSGSKPFSALVGAVAIAHASGESIVGNPTVQSALDDVVRAVANGPIIQGVVVGDPQLMRATAIAPDRPNGPPPISILRTGGRSLHLVDDSFLLTSSPKILNSTPLFWSATVTDAAGNPLEAEDFPKGRLAVAPASLFQLLSNPVKDLLPVDLPFIGLTRIALPDTKTAAFSLSVEQDFESAIANIGSLLIELWSLTTDIKPSADCTVAFAKVVVDSGDTGAFVSSPSSSKLGWLLLNVAGRAFFAFKEPSLLLPTDFQSACLKVRAADVAPVVGRFLRAKLQWLAAAIPIAKNVVGVATVVDKAGLLVANSGLPAKTVGICLDRNGWIRNCAKFFKADPENIVMAPGAVIRDWKVKAFDAADPPKETGLPTTLAATVPNSAVAKISGVGAIDVEALAPGDAKLELSDPATGATGSANLFVRVPQLSTQALTLRVGQSATIDFVDGNGRKIDRNAMHELILFDASKIEVPITKSDSSSFTLRALAAGNTEIFAHNLVYGNSLKLSIFVPPSNVTVVLDGSSSLDRFTNMDFRPMQSGVSAPTTKLCRYSAIDVAQPSRILGVDLRRCDIAAWATSMPRGTYRISVTVTSIATGEVLDYGESIPVSFYNGPGPAGVNSFACTGNQFTAEIAAGGVVGGSVHGSAGDTMGTLELESCGAWERSPQGGVSCVRTANSPPETTIRVKGIATPYLYNSGWAMFYYRVNGFLASRNYYYGQGGTAVCK